MKILTKKQEQTIKKMELDGDECLEKETFDSCLSALDLYVNAQMELYRAANDEEINGAKPYPHFNSSNVAYKAWYANLNDKMTKANAIMANPRIAKK